MCNGWLKVMKSAQDTSLVSRVSRLGTRLLRIHTAELRRMFVTRTASVVVSK